MTVHGTGRTSWPGDRVSFWVYGKPEPAGSKRAFPVHRRDGSTGVSVTDANPRASDWKRTVYADAVEAMQRYRGGERGTDIDLAPPLLLGPLGLSIMFLLRRPKAHYGTGRNIDALRNDAPTYPIVKPDTTKLVRAVEDAMTGIVWQDDAQVVEQSAYKQYAERGDHEGAHVIVWKL